MALVVVAPEAERELLRKCGVVPSGFFQELGDEVEDGDLIYLWPHDIDYSACCDVVNQANSVPVDFPAFFGLGKSSDDAERRAKERKIIGLLDQTLVHIVFLDKQKTRGGYAEFSSFDEIAKWGANLKQAIRIRFPNEKMLETTDRVLIIVSNGQQVSISPDEVTSFEACIGKDKVFTSCYFLDYNLHIGEGKLVHSAEVWDIVVGRLLLAFLLTKSENENAHGCFSTPGLKIWRAADCAAGVSVGTEKEIIENALSSALEKLHNGLAFNDNKPNLFCANSPEGESLKRELDENFPLNFGAEEWRSEPPQGWSDFNAKNCLNKTRDDDGSRWGKVFASLKAKFPEWKNKHVFTQASVEVKDVYRNIHLSPSALLESVRTLASRLRIDGAEKESGADWSNLANAEAKRKESITELSENTVEFEKAQAHYVGILAGIITFVAVSLALGWVGYRVVMLAAPLLGTTGWEIPMSIATFVFLALGSFAAMMTMMICHHSAGTRAMKEIIRESENADEMMKRRDACARELVANSISGHGIDILRACRFRVWALLSRLQSMLLTEVEPQTSLSDIDFGDEEAKSEGESVSEMERRKVRAGFLKDTRRVFGPYHLTQNDNFAQRIANMVGEWWTTRFIDCWRNLSLLDSQDAGYYPARKVVQTIRNFVSQFVDAARLEICREIVQDNNHVIRTGLVDWFETICQEPVYYYSSAAVTGLHVTERATARPVAFFSNDPMAVDIDALTRTAGEYRTIFGPFRTILHPKLCQTLQLAIVYQEFNVQLMSDPDTGLLTFKEATDEE